MNDFKETAFQKFKRFFEGVLDDRQVNVEFTDEDIGHLKLLLARMGYAMSTDWNKSYQDEEMCKNILTENLLLTNIYNIDTLTEDDLPEKAKPLLNEIKSIKDGDSICDLEKGEKRGSCQRFYFYRHGNKILMYVDNRGVISPQTLPVKVERKWISWSNYIKYKNKFRYRSKRVMIVKDAWGQGQPKYNLYVTELPNKNLDIFANIPNNFSNNLIRFYDVNGEITDLSKLDYVNCIKEIRNAIVHNYYEECVTFEDVIGECRKKNNIALVLLADRNKGISALVEMWFIYDLFRMPFVEKKKSFKFFYLPKFSPLKTREDCIKLLEQYRTVKINLAEEEYNMCLDDVFESLKRKFNDMPEPKDLTEFFETELKKLGYDATVECSKIDEIAFEKAVIPRIVNSSCLYKDTDAHGHKVADEKVCEYQENYIESLIRIFYDFKIVEDQSIIEKGDLKFISLNQDAMKIMIRIVFTNLDKLKDKQEEFREDFSRFKPEYSLLLVYLSLYNNLIDNGFNDSIKNLPNFKLIRKEEEILSAKGKLRDKINSMNFDGIKVKPPKGGLRDVEFKYRVEVINKIRNAIHSDEQLKKGEKTGEGEMIGTLKFRVRSEDNFKTMPLVFSPVNKNDWAVQTDINKFLKFISQPVFPQKQHEFKEVTWQEAEAMAMERLRTFLDRNKAK